ncbi:MAG: hypothetical protein IKZ57_06785 [Spirochaetia bacterium]|nr:hypothetical protein [Spirochaetia bacterium]
MKKFLFVMLIAFAMVLVGCEDIGFGHNNNGHHGGDNLSQAYELQADGSWKGTVDGTILKGTNAAYIAELDKAPAAGGQPSNVTAISNNYEYSNTSGTAKMVIIRTTGGNLTINAPNDTVLHYGEAGTVNVIAVASSSYDGYAAITQKLVAKAGHIKLFDLIAAAIPLIEVPADATGAVAVDIPEDVVVEAVTVASAQATSIKIEGSVSTITNTGSATPTVEVKETGIVDKTDGVTATGDGYVADNNGAGEMGEKPDKWDGSTYKVFTATGLKEIATTVNGGDNLSGKTVQLQRNISLLDEEWTPIGSKSADKPFSGTFDGNGKTISGLKITSGDYVALFGKITGATVKDFTIIGTITGATNAAGVVARMDSGTLSNITNKVNVTTGTKGGGVVCLTNTLGCTLTNCVNEGTITGSNAANGLGGVLGYANASTVLTSCSNSGTVADGTNGDFVGGVVGYIHDGTGISLTSCTNSGSVTGKTYTGGVVGYHAGIANTFNISNSSNSGAISGSNYAGGIIGGTCNATVAGCKNDGKVTATEIAGGLIGNLWRGSIDAACSGGSSALSANNFGRLIGSLESGADVTELVLAIGSSGTGSTSEKTIAITGLTSTRSGSFTVSSGTLYGCPYVEYLSFIKFNSGSKWVQDGSTTINMDSEKTYEGTVGSSTWNQQ